MHKASKKPKLNSKHYLIDYKGTLKNPKKSNIKHCKLQTEAIDAQQIIDKMGFF